MVFLGVGRQLCQPALSATHQNSPDLCEPFERKSSCSTRPPTPTRSKSMTFDIWDAGCFGRSIVYWNSTRTKHLWNLLSCAQTSECATEFDSQPAALTILQFADAYLRWRVSVFLFLWAFVFWWIRWIKVTLWSPHQQQRLKWTTWWDLRTCWPLTICWNPSAMMFWNPPFIQRSSTQFCEEGGSIFLIWSQSIQECLEAEGKRESTTANPKPKEIQVMNTGATLVMQFLVQHHLSSYSLTRI